MQKRKLPVVTCSYRRGEEMRAKILQYVTHHVLTAYQFPSIRDIGEEVGLCSSSTVHSHLDRLVVAGHLKRVGRKYAPTGLEFIRGMLQIEKIDPNPAMRCG